VTKLMLHSAQRKPENRVNARNVQEGFVKGPNRAITTPNTEESCALESAAGVQKRSNPMQKQPDTGRTKRPRYPPREL